MFEKVNTYSQLFTDPDNEYRNHIYQHRLSDVDWCDQTLFAFLFCAHDHIDELLEGTNVKLSFARSPFTQFKHLCNVKGDKIDDDVRQKNIEHVNKKQLDTLQSKRGIIQYDSCPDHENEYKRIPNTVDVGTEFDMDKRTLVLYFRQESIHMTDGEMVLTIQTDYFEFCAIAYSLHKLITEGCFKIFNDIKIVSREPYLYPRYIHKLCDIKYENENFIQTCNLGANTIHFGHGTAPDNACGTIPIYCNQMILNDDRQKDTYVRLNLSYNMKNHHDVTTYKGKITVIKDAYEQSGMNPEHNLDNVINSTITAVRDLEDLMLI
jgi:hypothetical protein